MILWLQLIWRWILGHWFKRQCDQVWTHYGSTSRCSMLKGHAGCHTDKAHDHNWWLSGPLERNRCPR